MKVELCLNCSENPPAEGSYICTRCAGAFPGPSADLKQLEAMFDMAFEVADRRDAAEVEGSLVANVCATCGESLGIEDDPGHHFDATGHTFNVKEDT